MALKSSDLSDGMKKTVLDVMRQADASATDNAVNLFGEDRVVDAFLDGLESAAKNNLSSRYPSSNPYGFRPATTSSVNAEDWLPGVIGIGVVAALGFGLWKAWPWLAGAVTGWFSWLGGHF